MNENEKIIAYLSMWCSAKNTNYPFTTFRLMVAGKELRFDNQKDFDNAVLYLSKKSCVWSFM